MTSNMNNDVKLLYWIIGFAEGDGSWFVGQEGKSYGFEISQHSIDTDVLFKIKAFLGFGAVYRDKTQERARYCLTRGHHQELIKIFNNRIKSDYKFDQFHRWCTFMQAHIDPTIPITSIGKDNTKIDFVTGWLSGFIDAEGCFRIAIDKRDKNRPKMIFEITQKELKPLGEIAELLSLKRNIRTDRGVYVLQTSEEKARKKIITYLDKFPLRTKKRISYELWKKAQGLDKKESQYLEKVLELKEKIAKNVKNIS